MMIRTCARSSIPRRRSRRRRWRWRNSAGCPVRRCCMRSSWVPRSNAASAMLSRQATTRAAGISPRHAAYLAPLLQARSCSAWMRSRPRMRWASPPASRAGWWRTCRVRRRMSASAMPPATACSPRCWRSRATPPRRPRSRARSAGPVPWATIRWLRRSTGGLGERWECCSNTYKPYPCGIVMHARGRCVPGAAARSQRDGCIRSPRSSCPAISSCSIGATVR